MWARGHYVDTVGNVNEEITKNYIKEQENYDTFDNSKYGRVKAPLGAHKYRSIC